MSTIHKGFTRFTELGHSLDNRVKIVEACTKVANELLKVFKVRKIKLWEELATFQSSSEATI